VIFGRCSRALRHLFLSEAARLWLSTTYRSSGMSPLSCLHGPAPGSLCSSGIVGECIYYWSLYKPVLRAVSRSVQVGTWFYRPGVSFPPTQIFRIASSGVNYESDVFQVNALSGVVSPLLDRSGMITRADYSLREGAVLSVAELPHSDGPPTFLLVGMGEDVIPQPDRDLFLQHRLHGRPAPPYRPHVTLVDAMVADQQKLSLLQSSAVPAESVFAIWAPVARLDRLDKLLKWYPKSPLCPKTKSFIVRFLHKKSCGLIAPCPHCHLDGGFDHEQFECRLTFAAFLHFCRQMAVWTGEALPTLHSWLRFLFLEAPREQSHLMCWNVSIWLFRRAVFAAMATSRIDGSLLAPLQILGTWKNFLSEFVGVVSRSEKHARKFTCRGLWLQERLPGMFTPVLTFLPLPL
jgi:hypothetical protein